MKTVPSFPRRGKWFATVDKLLALVCKHPDPGEVRINCGRATAMEPAIKVLRAMKEFMKDVVSGTAPPRRYSLRRGQRVVEYTQRSGRFSLICPERNVIANAY